MNFKIDKTFLNEAFNFSVGNYLAVWFTTAPNYILPLLVLNILGVEETAYYYIAFSIASLLFMIPGSISMSLLVEGSYGKELKKMIIKSFSIVFSIIIPALVILYFESDWFLNIFGKTYSENGGDLLKIMIFTSIFMTITSIYITIKRIQKDVNEIVILSGIIFLILIGSSYIFMLKFGLIGIGYAWVLSYGIGTVITGVLVWKNKWI
ncbi:lipopolysaccharide biosynthesis protein [Methanosarcina horonobensis]|uniref:lipopolysaccharide biosynthesis protein n=1 Tax=Methanosarcina horonobensis TaxID=418008 RepID=UPI000AAC02A1|nr:hypothetical protein [Methanosarcina horonobensis]